MTSTSPSELLSFSLLRPNSAARRRHQFPCRFRSAAKLSSHFNNLFASNRIPVWPVSVAASSTSPPSAAPPRSGIYTVGDFMTRREDLHVVKSTTTVDEALEMLVENRITGFPVIDNDWKLVGLVSDYDLLALDSISVSAEKWEKGDKTGLWHAQIAFSHEWIWNSISSYEICFSYCIMKYAYTLSRSVLNVRRNFPMSPSGTGRTDTDMFPEADSTWKTFNEIQKLLSKTNGKLVGDVMTPAPMVVRESTNLEDAARLLLETKFRRLPVVDGDGKLVGIITRGNVVRAALQIKRDIGMA
ncbi:hypothetical protein BUALT_Bualt16G0035900 [Buddleja alternifolia]|uniref:CBS domain-containing protein n=1 Tax=Buddleja alternifolia TaxID=168488 RepID=A0AAV6WH40_9LAMI|nr:hypothetical protein BUALT_Bualt16G0035900 [Buddleja alternifolia]